MESIVKTHQGTLLEAMPLVGTYEARLGSLNTWWDKISLIGKINSHNIASTILDDMQSTKDKFAELQEKLIHNLLLENLQKRILSDSSRSQVVIDILIRNLFERTADVGFLATDDDIRAFLNNPEVTEDDTLYVEDRLDEYVKKYSVYDEIIILDTQGNVCAHLDQSNPICQSRDALLEQTLNTREEYIETFRHSDLQPNLQHSLIYSCKITATNDPASPALGVLCLCFRFDDEMDGIFNNLMHKADSSILMVLNADGSVIARSDAAQVPLKTSFNVHTTPKISDYKGKKFLASMTRSNGYQGFSGLGWLGQVITPVKAAFSSDISAEIEAVCKGIGDQVRMFSEELKYIRKTSIDVNDDLSLVVLNGKITAARNEAAEFMPVLEEIKKIGEDTASIFSDSINNLLSTVVSSKLSDARFMAALSVDIMDRNLYERANDSRWWALTSDFRRILAQPDIAENDAQRLSEILAYINGLYTVYTNLYIYDKNGKVLAVSNDDERHIVGTLLDESSGSAAALGIADTQKYTVSPFVKTSLYADRHTYIYNASIMALGGASKVLGGIGIVFDSEPQFESMLADVLPCDEAGNTMKGCFGVFCDRSGVVVSVSQMPDLQPGDQLEIEKRFFEIENGGQLSEIIRYQDADYVLGVAVSQGYREYKTTGDYVNDVIGFVFMPF